MLFDFSGGTRPAYKYYKKLHELLNVRRVAGGFKYERLGNNGDGGYVVVTDESGCLSSCKTAYSFGIANDVSFDLELAKRGYEIFQYDHTIKRLPVQNEHFHWRKVGVAGKPSRRMDTLENLIRANGHENLSGIFLKMDIEGCEWDVINSLPPGWLKKFDQIALEFHDLLNYSVETMDKVLKTLSKIFQTHQAVHVHANNTGSVNYCGEFITPDFIEVTYVLKDKYKFSDENVSDVKLEIDQPNAPREDIELGIWNVN